MLTTPDELAADLGAWDDVELEKAEHVERTVETPDGPRTAIDHVVRAHRLARSVASD